MKRWMKQLVPFLIALSLFANVYLGVILYNRAVYANRHTWGNAIDSLSVDLVELRTALTSNSDNTIATDNPRVAGVAAQAYASLRSLPDYGRRVDDEEMRQILQFFDYAYAAQHSALKEQTVNGSISAESGQRLGKVVEGVNLILKEHLVLNALAGSRNPWNHADWRAGWHRIAAGLSKIDYVPLPE